MVHYTRDWSKDGRIVMENPKTIDLYCAQGRGGWPRLSDYNIKWYAKGAFDNFQPGFSGTCIHAILDDGSHLFGRAKNVNDWLRRWREKKDVIRRYCDPQEVYFYEWNNYECMFGGDQRAYDHVVRLFGEDRASKIVRVQERLPKRD